MSTPFNTTSHRFKSFCHTNNDIPTSPPVDARLDHIPDELDAIMSRANNTHPSDLNTKLLCCCGRPECIYLENNNAVLGGIERDLETAARLGQVRAFLPEVFAISTMRVWMWSLLLLYQQHDHGLLLLTLCMALPRLLLYRDPFSSTRSKWRSLYNQCLARCHLTRRKWVAG